MAKSSQSYKCLGVKYIT